MGAADRYKKWRQKSAQKPVILCDVGGTLLYPTDTDATNKPLIALLNRAKEMGFNVQICSGAIDENCFGSFARDLTTAKLNPELIENARGKDDIEVDTFSGVVAIIDDSKEDYMGEVKKGNPVARHFYPTDTEALLSYLNTVKPRGAAIDTP